MKHASVTNPRLRSPLMEAMRLNPKAGHRGKKKIVMTLLLTSLVDAFSIMLLYLLTQNTGNGSTMELAKAENLPSAIKAEALSHGTVIRVANGQYFLDEKPVAQLELAKRLQQLKVQLAESPDAEAIIIQADRTSDFSALIPIIRAGSVSGFNKFRFAVLQDEGQGVKTL